MTMYEYEEDSEIIGAHCTLLTPYKGYTEGNGVGNKGIKIFLKNNLFLSKINKKLLNTNKPSVDKRKYR